MRGGGGGGDGPRATITPQACSQIRREHARLRPTISSAWFADFSCSTFALRAIVARASDPETAASFAAQMNGPGEQPGRERPHLRTHDPRPRVGSGVAHVPAAGGGNFSDVANEIRRGMRCNFRCTIR